MFHSTPQEILPFHVSEVFVLFNVTYATQDQALC